MKSSMHIKTQKCKVAWIHLAQRHPQFLNAFTTIKMGIFNDHLNLQEELKWYTM